MAHGAFCHLHFIGGPLALNAKEIQLSWVKYQVQWNVGKNIWTHEQRRVRGVPSYHPKVVMRTS